MTLFKKIIRENWLLLYLIGIILLVFILLKSTNYFDNVMELDNNILNYFKSIAETRKTTLMKFFTFYGDFYIPLTIIILTAFVFRNNTNWKLLLFGYIFAGLVAFVAKLLVFRARPEMFLIEAPDMYSFPSGHTLTSTYFYITFAFTMLRGCSLSNKLIYYFLFTLLVIFIGISRMYLGVHYFTDVLGGFAIGLICSFIVLNIYIRNQEYIK